VLRHFWRPGTTEDPAALVISKHFYILSPDPYSLTKNPINKMETYSQSTVSTEQNLFELQVDHETTGYLSETAKWAKFLSIVGFVMCGLIVVAALFAGTIATLNPFAGTMGAGGFMQIVLLLAMAALYFFPCLFLFNFARKMQFALRNNDQINLNDSFRNLKSNFKFVGILTIVILSFYAIGILVVGIMAATR
jgi:hypothetical protein